MRWFRLYEEVLDDPKVQSLPGDLFKFWINVLCIASKCNGKLPLHETLSFHLREPKESFQEKLKRLIEVGLLVEKKGILIPNKWFERQYKSDSSTERVRKHREKKRNVTETFHETFHNSYKERYCNAPETETETETDKQEVIDKKESNTTVGGKRELYLSLFQKYFSDHAVQKTLMSQNGRLMLVEFEKADVSVETIETVLDEAQESGLIDNPVYYRDRILGFGKTKNRSRFGKQTEEERKARSEQVKQEAMAMILKRIEEENKCK